jgi:hypothetical protein
MAAITEMRKQCPTLTVKEMWNRFPDDPERRIYRINGQQYYIYKEVDTGKLCQENEDGKSRTVSFGRFGQLATIAKKSQKK